MPNQPFLQKVKVSPNFLSQEFGDYCVILHPVKNKQLETENIRQGFAGVGPRAGLHGHESRLW